MTDATPPSQDELRAKIERAVRESPFGDILADPIARRRKLFELMAATDDPMTRELGRDLLSGRTSPRDVVTSSSYTGYLNGGLEKLAEVSLADLAEQLETQPPSPQGGAAPPEDEEDYSERSVMFRRPQ
ncbi:hypothetical protein [Actinokineospora sp.]|uniref:hypothetical protein n=1 Tax=Actinokineospora sp. TaxID=1872133 RepID=UPI004037F61D